MANIISEGPGDLWGSSRKVTTQISTGAISGDITSPVKIGYNKYFHRGHDTPNFGKLKKEGKILPMTSWYQFRKSASIESGSGIFDDNGTYRSDYTGTTYWFPAESKLLLGDSAAAYTSGIDFNALVAQASANIYSQGFDALTFLAEIHKTHRLFRDILKRNLDNILSGKAYNNWLELRYGWRVLVKEIQDLQQVLSSLDDKRERFKNSVGYSNVDTTVETYEQDYGVLVNYYNISTTVDVSARGTVVLDIEPPKFAFNPITTAWELIPYSFVIDWFIGVGTWFESLSAQLLSSDSTAAGGYKVTVTRNYSLTSTTWSSGWTGLRAESGWCEIEETVRAPQSIPKLPQIGSGLNALKTIDLISLLLAAIRK